MTTKLLHVRSTVAEFHGHKDVAIDWFVRQRHAPTNRPYRELIEGEPIDDANTRGWIYEAIDELFSEAEAAAWAVWLRKNRPGEHALTEANLPYPPNIMPITAIPMGGLQDCLMIWRSRGYDLPFKVEGYFDLRHYEPVSKVDHPEKSTPRYPALTSAKPWEVLGGVSALPPFARANAHNLERPPNTSHPPDRAQRGFRKPSLLGRGQAVPCWCFSRLASGRWPVVWSPVTNG